MELPASGDAASGAPAASNGSVVLLLSDHQGAGFRTAVVLSGVTIFALGFFAGARFQKKRLTAKRRR